MPVGISYDGTYPLRDFVRVVEAGEKAGLDSIWLTEEFIYRDPMVIASLVLKVTERIHVIPGPVSPYLKHPLAIAREALTLAEISNGRLDLQLGVGDLSGLKQLGVDVSHPLSTVKEALSIVGALCRGDAVQANGGVWDIEGITMKLGGIAPIRLFLAAMGPKMLALARSRADGTVLSHMMSVPYIRQSVELSEAEADPSAEQEHEYVEFFATSLADDQKTAYAQIRPRVARWLGVPYPQPVHRRDWKLCDLDIDYQAIYQALCRGDLKAACDLVSDEAIATLSVSGTPKDLEKRINEYMDAGVTYPVIGPVGDVDTIIRTVQLAGEMFGDRGD